MPTNPLDIESIIIRARNSPRYQALRASKNWGWTDAQEEAWVRGWREASLRAFPPSNANFPPQMIRTSDGRLLKPTVYRTEFVTQRTGTTNKCRKAISAMGTFYDAWARQGWSKGEDNWGGFSEQKFRQRQRHKGYRL